MAAAASALHQPSIPTRRSSDLRLLRQAEIFDEERHRVDAEPGDAELQPKTHDLVDLFAHRLVGDVEVGLVLVETVQVDRKSTRLNSSHGYISYAVFCLKKKSRS